MTKVIVLKPEEVVSRPDLVGTWLDETHYHTLVEEDMDLYLPPECATGLESGEASCGKQCNTCESGLSEKNIVFKFRKNFFTQEEILSAYDGLKDAAQPTENRGTASGPREETLGNREWVTAYQEDILKCFKDKRDNLFGDDPIQDIIDKYQTMDKDKASNRNNVWSITATKEENFIFDEWVEKTRKLSAEEASAEANRVENKMICKTTYGNTVLSGIAGWYDRYPRIPYGRSTTYTRDNREKFEKSFPYLKRLAEGFKELLPWRYGNQMEAASRIDPEFLVPGTPFSTITVNRSFRTAAHYDPANMENGFANICVFSNNDNYTGGYLVFPEIGYAANIRPGDLLFVNNMAGLHGNTEMIFNEPDAVRYSCIAFFHEGMLSLGSYEYEDYRRQFVDHRRLDKSHPLQRDRWNGISPGMWSDSPNDKHNYEDAKEWYEFLKLHPKGDEWLDKHHPWLKDAYENMGLEEFF